MSLNTNLKKIFESLLKTELNIEIVKSTHPNLDANGETLTSGELAEGKTKNLDDNSSEGFLTSITEDKLNDIAVLTSRENLELGCMLIKKKVIEKALRKVKEDIQITQAVERR